MTKRDLIKALRGLPDNAEIVLVDKFNKRFKFASEVLYEGKARVKKIVISTNPLHTIDKDRLLHEARTVYVED